MNAQVQTPLCQCIHRSPGRQQRTDLGTNLFLTNWDRCEAESERNMEQDQEGSLWSIYDTFMIHLWSIYDHIYDF